MVVVVAYIVAICEHTLIDLVRPIENPRLVPLVEFCPMTIVPIGTNRVVSSPTVPIVDPCANLWALWNVRVLDKTALVFKTTFQNSTPLGDF